MRFVVTFVAALLLFLVLNLIVASVRSDCGLPAVLGMSGCADDIVRVEGAFGQFAGASDDEVPTGCGSRNRVRKGVYDRFGRRRDLGRDIGSGYGIQAAHGSTISLPRRRKEQPDREALADRFDLFLSRQ